MAWNIGANDLANSMGDVVGSKALTLKQVILLAALLNILGATFFGSRVTKTVGEGIVPISGIDAHLVIIGCLSALLAAALWVTVATYFCLPVSTSHSVVGAMLGFGIGCSLLKVISFSDISWTLLIKIIISWILSPLVGMAMAFLIYKLFLHFLRKSNNLPKLESGIMRYLVIISSSYQAFSFGSNDVANAVAPLSTAFGTVGAGIPIWILVFGGIGIAIGLSTWGYRVVWTIGKKITDLTPSRGFSADIACATTVLICSALGMPVSTTHTIVGAVIGVGLARGFDAVNFGKVKQIVYSWVITVPAAAGISILIYLGLIGIGV
jgi:PiT family inorganic phosphate transporter